MKILIIEDDEFDFRLVKRSLERAFPTTALEFDWVDTPSVSDLCQRIEEFDVCFVDFRLGTVSGIELIRELCDAGATTPLILLTGDETVELDQSAIAAGAADFLHKDKLSVNSIHRLTRFCLARNEQEKRLTEMAYCDALTGLANRAAFDHRCKVALSNRDNMANPLALILFDLDKFKEVNDTHGHPIGDVLLQDFSTELASHFGAGSMVARLGGDEFGVLLDVQDPKETPTSLRKWLRSVLKSEFQIAGLTLTVPCSMGIVVLPPNSGSHEPSDVLNCADRCLYSDKRLRKLEMLNGMGDGGGQDLDLDSVVHSLEIAVERHEFEVFYQPKVNCRSGEITGLEALLRWNSPHYDLGPAYFIPLAEEFGLIRDIGRWVLRVCCAQLHDWIADGQDVVPVSVNVSPIQLEDSNFAEMVKATLMEFQLEARLIEFELTEGAFGLRHDSCLTQMQSVADLGCVWAIDDFGVGFSSLSRLHKLPISRLKIDKSFLDQLPADPAARDISNAIISMARSLTLNVVAEGVEDPDQLTGLNLSDSDELQGYYCYRPMNARAATALLDPPQRSAVAS